MLNIKNSLLGQAIAPATIRFSNEAFKKIDYTAIRWLGNAGAFINSRGTTLLGLIAFYQVPNPTK